MCLSKLTDKNYFSATYDRCKEKMYSRQNTESTTEEEGSSRRLGAVKETAPPFTMNMFGGSSLVGSSSSQR